MYLNLESARRVCLALNLDRALAYKKHNFHWKSYWHLQYSCYRIKSITDSSLSLFKSLQLNPKFRTFFNLQQKFAFAVIMNDVDLILKLKNSVQTDFDSNLAIRLAAKEGHTLVLEELLKDSKIKVDPSALNNYAIQHASFNGHYETVQRLLKDDRVDPGDDNNLAINLASQKGHEAIVELLLKSSKVDPSDMNNSAIHAALKNNHLGIVESLIKDSRVYNLLDDTNLDLIYSRLNVKERNREKF